MPHAASFEAPKDDQAERDDALIAQLTSTDPNVSVDLKFDRELSPGEKADDAVDYEDISDDDLAEDEDELPQDRAASPAAQNGMEVDDLFGDDFGGDDGLGEPAAGNDAPHDELDDLFGGTSSSPPPETNGVDPNDLSNGLDLMEGDEVFGEPIGPVHDDISPTKAKVPSVRPQSGHESRGDVSMVDREEPTEEELLQQRLFALSNLPPAPPENQEELLASLWPKFERDTIPRFMDLLPPKKARYLGKTPLKAPKPVQPTKISLELGPDHEKMFKISAAGTKRTWESMEESGLVTVKDMQAIDQAGEDDVDADSDYEAEPVGGVSWEDFQVICEDWDIPSAPESVQGEVPKQTPHEDDDDIFDDIFDTQLPPSKRQKLGQVDTNVLNTPQFSMPPLHDLESATRRVARAVTLDLNDAHLLIDENQSVIDRHKRKNKGLDLNQNARAGFSRAIARRYNISNDPAYELLKENHQSRVRSTLGQPTITHSLPAVRLQWPYYKTKLARQEARSFHRPTGHFTKGEPITFQTPIIRKKKHLKGKDVKELYDETEKLSLKDNSHLLLLEYSEEHPDLMCNFGMGSRVINYYRKKDLADPERPKLDIGEVQVLLPQDKSPFSIFGHIDPGEVTPAIYNGLYRAPIFQQKAKPSDFLMIRNSTGKEGVKWYMRSIEYLRVVGQLFPSQEVPRPNGRKVSTAAKNRVKMIAYRLMRRADGNKIGVFDVTEHVSDSIELLNRQKADMQSRQKMKEFLSYNKEYKLWGMAGNQPVPDEDSTRSALPPEDACLVEAVQVGQQHLEDAGFTGQDEEEEEGDDKEGKTLEQQLAPWLTTKNFMTACAGKAMLQLHGEGDPSGRGEAFSFLKTSMKGGFKALGESVEDKIDAKKLKENNGHSYNVAKQARAYDDSIRRIWEAQTQSLSSTMEHSDAEMDIDDPEERASSIAFGATPKPEIQNPSLLRRQDDETMSQFSKFSTDSQSGRLLKIVRKLVNHDGSFREEEEIVKDPKVIRQYLKRKALQEAESIDLNNVKTGDITTSEAVRQKIQTELDRLERNKERRLAREKQKAGAGTAGSPSSPNSPATGPGRGSTTGRKCANCGQVGHIKTNKK
ncbi:MAG: hypothetical protein MMC23_006104 [Stictis urceolatum]|nr:hypothetical protein [Stictis urceolata]